jgi:hypothetical protein
MLRMRRGACLTGAVVTLVAMVGCTHPEEAHPSPAPRPAAASSPAPVATPSLEPSAAAADQAAREAYLGFVAAAATAYQSGDADDPALVRYVTEPLLDRLREMVRTASALGLMQQGAPHPVVVSSSVDLVAAPPTVTIHSCVDQTGVTTVYRSNRSPIPHKYNPAPYLAERATVVWVADDRRWRVSDSQGEPERSCSPR